MTGETTAAANGQSAHEQFAAELEALRDRIESLESELERKDDRIERLESQLEEVRTETDDHECRLDDLEQRQESIDARQKPIDARLDAHEKKLAANKARVSELQARELEKGAHLLEDHVDETGIDVADGRLERIRKESGDTYFRLPESHDPLERGGTVALAHGDLLPIQQLARMDEEMRRSAANSLPTRLAAKLWKARTDPTVGDNPWKTGCKGVREYVMASDMRRWIRRQDPGIGEAYAKKLVTRTIDALKDLSKNRLAVRKQKQRKNSLSYTERRVVLMDDADIPGETPETTAGGDDCPVTNDVHG